MRRPVTRLGLLGCIGTVALWFSGCGGGGGDGSELTADETYTYTQPRAGMVVSAGSWDLEYVDVFVRGTGWSDTVPAYGFAWATEEGLESTVTSINRTSASPFQFLTVTGTGYQTEDSAISVIFRADGLEPVAVPAISVTATTIEVAVPALINSAGENVAARATVQVFQTGQWGFSITNQYDGLDIGELPRLDAQVPAGAVLDAYLTSGLNLIEDYQAVAPADLPDSFWSQLATLKADLINLQSSVQEVVANPVAAPTVPSSGAETVTLDAATLALTDRLLASLLLRLGEEFDFATTQNLPAGVSTECPPLTSGGWVDDFLCEEQRFKEKRAELAPKAFMLGAKIEASVFLGMFGGMSANLMGLIAPRAATAFELAWTAISGHMTAWVVGDEPPSSGETLAEVGLAALDKYAGTYGIPSAAYSAIKMGQESDALIALARETSTTPPPSLDGSYQGSVSGTATESFSGCLWQHALSVTVTVTNFGGNGTMIDPYVGDVTVTGNDNITLLSGSDCDVGGTVPISATGWVDGTAGKVDILATYFGDYYFSFAMPSGTWDGSSITGSWVISSDAFVNDISGTVVLN